MSVQQIQNSTNQGCNWCSFISTFISAGEKLANPDDVLSVYLCDFYPDYSTPRGKNAYYLNLEWEKKRASQSPGWALRLHAFTESTNPAAEYVTAQKLQTDIYSEASICQIQNWLGECSNHEECPEQAEKTLPTRLIEVSPTDSPDQPRLRTTAGKRGSYVALSYCWGIKPHTGLNQSNLEANMNQLNVEELPPTMRDAILVTRSMSVPYLWVDSLCIIQDSDDDKRNEMSRMAQIYADSMVTIVAASSESVTEGFLKPRQKLITTYTIPFRLSSNRFGTMSVGILDDMEYEESAEPINKRAWTLQESILASRYLIYSSHTLQWRCSSGLRNLGNSLHLVSYADDDQYSESFYTLSKQSSDPQKEFKRWLRLVHVYSNRSASFSQDKLNAISAVASKFSPTLGPRYYAGLWQYSLLWQLTWVTSSSWNSEARNTRPEIYRAPTWSWTSIDGELYYDSTLLEEDNGQSLYRCELISCETSPKSAELPFGEVLAGSLRIKGILKKAWLKPSTKTIIWLDEGDESFAAAEANQAAKNKSDHGEVDRWSDQETSINGYHDEGSDQPPTLIFCLPISVREETIAMGLLLIESDIDTFRRIGSFEGADRKEFDHLPQHQITIL